MKVLRRYGFASMPVLLACLSAVVPARAQGPSMRDMFRGIPTDRCKDLGGPPAADESGPRIDSLDGNQGAPGAIVLLRGAPLAPAGRDEVRFLLKGKETVSTAESVSPSEIRTRVPDMGVRGKAERGWVFLVRKVGRKELRGRAVSFLFLPAGPPGDTRPGVPPDRREESR